MKMLVSIFFSFVFLVQATISSALEKRATCTPNNCLKPVESAGVRGASDCSSYERAAVTSSIVYVETFLESAWDI